MTKTTQTKDAATPVEQPRVKAVVKPMEPRRMSDPDFGWRVWEVTLPITTTREEYMDGRFWRLCAPRVRRGDRLAWRNDNLTAFGELVIVSHDTATGNLQVRELWCKEIEGATFPETESCGFTPRDLGVHDGWAIFRDADGHCMQKNIPSFNEAVRRIKTQHIPDQIAQVAAGHAVPR